MSASDAAGVASEILRTFRHGVHPHEHKEETAGRPIERLPFVERYVLPLSQHTGAPSLPVVSPGELVSRGQVLGKPGGFVSTALHSPVSGTVVAIEQRRHPFGRFALAIEIEADPYSPQRLREPAETPQWSHLDHKGFVDHIQAGGMVGMGGAAFPSHVKYLLPDGKRCTRLVVNGCECEPYLSCDHRVMVERPDAVIRGIEIVRTHLGAKQATVGIERNKCDAVDALRSAINGEPIEVDALEVKYPQGAEKVLVKALFGLEIPAGKLPLDVEMVVNNVGTMAAITDWFELGLPLIERVITVAGPGIARPGNVLVPIGTPVREVLRHCGGLTDDAVMVVMGGPMMGMPLASLDVPVIKGTSGLLAFTEAETGVRSEYACIRCARCLEACAYFLNPSRLARLARAERWNEAEAANALDCMECGACSFSCPSGIPIVQLIRVAKNAIRAAKK